MEINVNDFCAYMYDIIDLSTNKRIPLVQWANDKTGEYEVLVTDIKDEMIIENGKAKTIIKKGRIKIVRKPAYK